MAESKRVVFWGAIEKLNERLDSLKDYRIINRDLVVKDLERLKKRFDTEVINAELSEQLAKINVNLSRSYSEKGYLRLEKATGSERMSGGLKLNPQMMTGNSLSQMDIPF